MSFLWPPLLVCLLLVPVGIVLAQAADRRRRRRLGDLGGVAGPAARRPVRRIRDRLPAVLAVAAFVVLAVALARPQAAVSLPSAEGTVILAFDVSASMTATDLSPSRLEAAKTAATTFVEAQPPGVVIGVVAFSDSGLSVQPPTSDRAAVVAAIDRLTAGRGTSLGQGILASLTAIAQAESDTPAFYYSDRSPEPSPSPTPVPAGSHDSAVVILLSDGENTEAPDPVAAAQTAADRGIRIDTVGIGSPGGATLDLDGFQVHTQLDEATLQRIADLTDGSYYRAGDADQLTAVYAGLDPRVVFKTESIEITALVAVAGIALLLAAGVASLAWSGRLP